MKHPRLSITYTALMIGIAMSGCANAPKSQQALQLKPAYHVGHSGGVDLSYGYIARAREMEADDRLDQAAIWWARAVGASPTRADAHHGLGLCLARMGRVPEGIASLREAAALAPRDARILNNLGHALKLQGERAEAIALFQAALRADPQHAQARYNLATLEQDQLSLAVAQAAAPASPALQPAATMAQAPTPESPEPKLTMSLTTTLGVQQTPNAPALALVSSQPEPVQLKHSDTLKVVPLTSVALNDQAVPASTMSVTLTGLTVEVFNGNGIAGAAKGLSKALAHQGLKANRVANMAKYDVANTRIVYRPGKAAEARALAKLLPTSSELEEANATQLPSMRADVRVVLGRNLGRMAADCLSRASCVGEGSVKVAMLAPTHL